jgi:AAT family amino acid transporter/D-serine/D-alanine/glycine transporter
MRIHDNQARSFLIEKGVFTLNESENLKRGLKNRHIQLIAIGGAIGVGLFLGSAKAIQAAGPSLMISYLIFGVIVFFMMRALGEMILYKPISGSFSDYAQEFIGPWAAKQ